MNQETLRLQYERAIELYLHEDELVWKKINQMIGFNFAILGAFGFVLTRNDSIGVAEYFLCALGLVFSFGFYLAIKSGIVFLHRRRDQAKEIEALLEDSQIVMRSGEKTAVTQSVQPYSAWLFIGVWFVLTLLLAFWPELFLFQGAS